MDDLRANFFNVYLCHVCQTKESFNKSKLCSGCKLVSYCSKDHQKADWRSHKNICKVTQSICRDGELDDLFAIGLRAVDFSFYLETNGLKSLQGHPLGPPGSTRKELKSRVGFLVGSLRNQDLDRVELKMMFLPYHCAVCFTRGSVKKELVCRKCYSADYCSAEHQSADAGNHGKLCPDFQRALDMDLFLLKFKTESLKLHLIKPKQAVKLKLAAYDMKSFIAKYISPGFKFEEEVLSSIFLTNVLTFAHTISRFSNFSLGKNLIVHLVGAHAQCEGEPLILRHWENLLHFFPQVHSLIIVHISPCIAGPSMGANLCIDCCRANKSITFLFYNQLYHEFQDSTSFLKPDVIVAFNSGLFESLLDYDPWKESLPLFFKYENVPVILTEAVEGEAKSDVKRLRPYAEKCGKKVHFVLNCEKNPFNNLRPWRGMDSGEVRKKNSHVTAFITKSG